MCAALWIAESCRIEAGSEISFCIKVKNPAQPQQGPDTMTIFSSDGNSYQDLEYSKQLLSLPYASMEDPRPMYIRSPEFKMLEIEQSSPRQARAQRQGLGVSASISLIQPLSR